MYPEQQRVFEGKRVVLITGAQSNWYEQAIFIVRGDKPRPGTDVVMEAERIIQAYLNKTPYAPPRPKAPAPQAIGRRRPNARLGGVLNAVIFISLAAVCCMVGYAMLRL